MALCDTPSTYCRQFNLQDPITQRYLLVHLLAELINSAGGSVPTDDATLFANTTGYACQGSPNTLRYEEAKQTQNADLDGVTLSKITCYSPLAIESVMAYLTCVAIDVVT